LADLRGTTLVILDNLSWYCDIANVFIRQRLQIDYFCVSKLSIDLFFKLPVSRFLAINIEGKIGQLTLEGLRPL
jgi:hypothetical protein